MHLQVFKKNNQVFGEVNIPGSKSESNRLLILKAIFSNLKIGNLSTSDDTLVLQNALSATEEVIDIHHAGTAMRFLTAFFSFQKNRSVILTGSERMQERPVKILVDALRSLGAEIEYVKNEGFPPLKITGTEIKGDKVTLPANISSQYISALMLVAPALLNGLEIYLKGEITSQAYIEMTLQLLNQIGVDAIFQNKKIVVGHCTSINDQMLKVEPDWSSASYYYSMVALSSEAKIRLFHFQKNSLQGDSVVAEIYKSFGVRTVFEENFIVLEKIQQQKPEKFQLDMKNAPDLAQTIAVTCLGMGIDCHLTGLHTLKIKETDRIVALKNEMEKFGASVKITDDSLAFSAVKKLKEKVIVATYNDHRMAMAFAPLGIFSNLKIQDYEVVSKSYPQFWKDIESLGFQLQKIEGITE